MVVKARLVPFFGDRRDLHKVFRDRVQSDATVLKYCKANQVLNDWLCDSYVCTDTRDVYRSFYYRLLDKFYVVIEMLTDDNRASAKFRSLVPGLIDSLDYSLIDERSELRVGEGSVLLQTPSTFRYSSTSTADRLVFLGECKYLFVGISVGEKSLLELVQGYVRDANGGLSECKVQFDASDENENFEWARYTATDRKEMLNYGTYFRQKLETGDWVTSFLLEIGSVTTDVEKLLEFQEVDDA
jgi:hypothetical protein